MRLPLSSLRRDHTPVSKQHLVGTAHPVQPFGTSWPAPVQALILPSGPTLQSTVDVPEDAKHRNLVELAIVIPPPLYHRVVQSSHVGKRYMGLAGKAPPPHCLPHPLQGTLAGSRQEVGKRPPLCGLRAFLGLNVKPRNVKLACGWRSLRLLSLQNTIFDFSGCIVSPQAASRVAMDRITYSACLRLWQ